MFEGTAITIINAYILWADSEEAYCLCMSELEIMYSQEADTVIPSLQQAARGRQLQSVDYNGHCKLYANLRQCQALAKNLHNKYDINRDNLLNSIIENHLGHMSSNIFMERQKVRRESGKRFDFDQPMVYLSNWVAHLQRQRSTSGRTANANVASPETAAAAAAAAAAATIAAAAAAAANKNRADGVLCRESC